MTSKTILATVLALGLAAPMYAATTTSKDTKSSSTHKAAATWANGDVERFDAATQTLVLKQGTHEMTFELAPTAKTTEAKKTVPNADLANAVGQHAKVQYMTENGKHVASHVELSKAAKASSTSTKKK
jgi:hypothetical protein